MGRPVGSARPCRVRAPSSRAQRHLPPSFSGTLARAARPEFPGLLNPQEQGRFALGFHQQKGQDERDRKAASAAKKIAAELDAKTATPTPTRSPRPSPPRISRVGPFMILE